MTQSQALEILKQGHNVFLTGEPGSGKTYTINQFVEWLEYCGKTYAVTASTGIAATHLNGMTIHSWSGIGVKKIMQPKDIQAIQYNKPYLMQKLQNTSVLIVDEVSMLDSDFIKCLDYVLKQTRGSRDPFGGVQMIFVGDFFQLPPVSQATKAEFAFKSQPWLDAELKICYLTEQHRQAKDEYLDVLSAIRTDTVTPEHTSLLASCENNETFKTHLFTHNFDVDKMNAYKLSQINGTTKTYTMKEWVVNDKLKWMVEKLKDGCLSPERLELKVGATVMFTRNKFDQETKEILWVNGTIGEVVGFNGEGFPTIKTRDGATYAPSYETWTLEDNGKELARIEQIPLKLAWAITVHKSQGMTLDEATIDLSKVFEYGQGYVALSRVKSLRGLKLTGLNDMALKVHPEVVEYDNKLRSL